MSVEDPGRSHSPELQDGSLRTGRGIDAVFDNVGTGEFRVRVDDPRFEPYLSEPVERGGKALLNLVGSASIELDARLVGGGEPTDLSAELTHLFTGGSASNASFDASIEEGLIDDLTPWTYTLMLKAEEGTCFIEVPDLKAGEQRRIEAVIAPRGAVRGRMVHPDGAVAEGAHVRLVWHPARAQPGSRFWEVGTTGYPRPLRYAVAESRVGADGAFDLGVERPGRYAVFIGGYGAPQRELEVFDVGPGDIFELGDVIIPSGGRLRIRFTGRPVSELDGSEVKITVPGGRSMGSSYSPPVKVDQDGRVDLGPFPAGAVTVFWFPSGSGFRGRFTGNYPGNYPAGAAWSGTVHAFEGQTRELELTLPRQ